MTLLLKAKPPWSWSILIDSSVADERSGSIYACRLAFVKEFERFDLVKPRQSGNLISSLDHYNICFLRFTSLLAGQSASRNKHRRRQALRNTQPGTSATPFRSGHCCEHGTLPGLRCWSAHLESHRAGFLQSLSRAPCPYRALGGTKHIADRCVAGESACSVQKHRRARSWREQIARIPYRH